MAPRTRDICLPLSPKKRTLSMNGFKSQEPFRQGEVLCDVSQNKWKLGRCVGVGAFGEVYLASDDLSKPVTSDAQYVVKVEPHSNGPLFVEMNYYLRATKEESIEKWKNSKRQQYLGVPQIRGFGSHVHKTDKYRFIVLPRYGDTISKLFLQHSKKFHVKTAFTLASHLLDNLEYIHSQGYVHLDLKGANMMLGWTSENDQAPLYLVDYGLAARYTDLLGLHKEYVPDRRKAEAGTLEYISRDAHLGAMSRRCDLESLGYNLVHWLTGSLPWLGATTPELVYQLKEQAMSNIRTFLASSFKESPPPVLNEYLQYVGRLEFTEEPDYDYCRQLFSRAIRDSGFLDDYNISFENHVKLTNKAKKRKALEAENYVIVKRMKIKKTCPVTGAVINSRRPFRSVPQNTITTRVTRNQVDAGIKLRSAREFDWATVLAGNPEAEAKALKPKKERVVKQNESLTSHQRFGEMLAVNEEISQRKTTSTLFHTEAFQPNFWSESRKPKFWEDSLRNPTPAMIKLIKRKERKRKQHDRKAKNDSFGPPSYYTPAMQEVMAIAARSQIASRSPFSTKPRVTFRSPKPSPKVLRSSSRKTARKSADAIFACAKF